MEKIADDITPNGPFRVYSEVLKMGGRDAAERLFGSVTLHEAMHDALNLPVDPDKEVTIKDPDGVIIFRRYPNTTFFIGHQDIIVWNEKIIPTVTKEIDRVYYGDGPENVLLYNVRFVFLVGGVFTSLTLPVWRGVRIGTPARVSPAEFSDIHRHAYFWGVKYGRVSWWRRVLRAIVG